MRSTFCHHRFQNTCSKSLNQSAVFGSHTGHSRVAVKHTSQLVGNPQLWGRIEKCVDFQSSKEWVGLIENFFVSNKWIWKVALRHAHLLFLESAWRSAVWAFQYTRASRSLPSSRISRHIFLGYCHIRVVIRKSRTCQFNQKLFKLMFSDNLVVPAMSKHTA